VSRFTSHLGLRLLEYSDGSAVTIAGGAALLYHTEPLVWELGAVGSGDQIIVPAFFPELLTDHDLWLIATRRAIARGVTDGGSIPQAFRWLINPWGDGAKPFALHDDGYKTQGWYGRMNRKAVDDLLYEALIAVRVEPVQAKIIHAAVREFGGKAWGT
jgi:hypothetical protein